MVARAIWVRLAVVAVAGGSTVAIAHCGLIAGLQTYHVVDDAAAADGSADAGAGDADDCMHAYPPARPSADDGNADLGFYVAMRSIDFGIGVDAGATTPYGYDLDRVCTCPGPSSCVPPLDITCDDAGGGRDNALGGVFRLYAALSNGTFNQESFNALLASGAYGLVVRVRHYNGAANDTQVEMTVFTSNGTAPTSDAGAADAGRPAPVWDGNDSWTLDNTTVIGTDTSVYYDANAYVANHVLVANIPPSLGLVPLRFVGKLEGEHASQTPTPMKIALAGMILTGRLAPELGSFRLDDGVIAGRWPVDRLPELVNEFPEYQQDGGTICPGTPTYNMIRTFFCSAGDIAADPRDSDAAAPCSALSVAIGFTAYPTQRGPVTAHVSTSTCANAGRETCAM